MDFKAEKKTVFLSETREPVAAQQNIGADINLPDYCSDIKRILKCIIMPGITAVSISGEKITATGTAEIKLIYVSEKDKIDCYETQKDISVIAESKGLNDNVTVSARAKTNYVNCRATSQRRISIEGNIGITFELTEKVKKEIFSSCHGNGIQLKGSECAYESLICQREKVFDMGETVQIPAEKGIVGKILRCSAWAVLDSKKAVSDKLLIKGQLYTQLLYCKDNDEGKTEIFRHSMPISQIIDLQGIDENTSCSVSLSVRCITARRKPEASSDSSLIEIGAKVAAMCKCTLIDEVTTVEDCYSTSHEIKAGYTLEEFLCPVEIIERQKTVKKTVEIPSGDIGEIIDIWSGDVSSSMKGEGKKVKGECTVTLCLLYFNDKGVPQYTEKDINFTFEAPLKEEYEYLRCRFACDIRNIDVTVMARDKFEVSVETGIYAGIYSSVSKRILRDLQVLVEKADKDDAALTLYFPAKGERLWDIARRYSTTSEAIKNENNMESDTVEGEKMLLIPAV